MLVKIKFQSAKVHYYPSKDGKISKFLKKPKLKLHVDRIDNDIARPDEQLISSVDCGNYFGTADNLIHYEHISNMLAVLIGERPVSTFHTPIVDGKQIRHRIAILDEIAKNGFVKLDNIYFIETDNEKTYITEMSTCRKSGPSNSQNKPTITWRRYRNHFIVKPENLEKSLSIFQKYLKKPFNPENYSTIDEAISEIKNGDSFDEFEEKLGEIELKGFVNDVKSALFPNKTSRLSFVSQDTYPMLTLSISGEFIMDVPENIYKRMVFGVKFATYLDGGLATLEKWEETGTHNGDGFVDEYDIIDNGFVKVSEIDKRD